MKRLNVLLSLTTDDNDYQLEQASAAEETARRLDIALQILYAGNDAITQSQQLLKAIQSPPGTRPDAIVFEPAGGTALPQVASAAASAGIGWAVLNRDADYIGELRRITKAPIFSISSNHEEIGRIQGRQLAALLPNGGAVLYIQGPSENLAAKQRTLGMQETKPANVQVAILRGQWTEISAHRAVTAWLRLSTSHKARIDVVAGQDDSMALGARKAFEEHTHEPERARWLSLPYTGCDGLPKTGQEWVRTGLLTATVVVPPNTSLALETLARAIQSGKQPLEHTTTVPASFPAIEVLSAKHSARNRFQPV